MNLTRVYKKIFNIIFFLTFSTTSFGLSQDAKLPIYFKSDSLIYNKKQNEMTYIGHVYITEGSTKIGGNKVIVQYGQNNQVKKLIDVGKPAYYSTLLNHQRSRLDAQAEKIIFDPVKNIIMLKKHAKITQEENRFTAPYIWYDITKGVVKTTPTQNQKTVIVIQPQDQ